MSNIPASDPADPAGPSAAEEAVAAVGRLESVPKILEVIAHQTGLGFCAVVRVTDTQCVACAVRDRVDFGIAAGGKMDLHTTICRETATARVVLACDDTASDATYRDHPATHRYGFRSFVAAPIVLPSGETFGSLLGCDPEPRHVDEPTTRESFKLYAELIGNSLDAERALRNRAAEERDRLRSVVASARDYAVISVDAAGTIDGWSAGAADVFGWTEAQAIGRPFDLIWIPEDVAAGSPAHELRVAREAGVCPDNRVHCRADDRRIFVVGACRPVRNAAGGLVGYVKVCRDETDRKANEQKVAEAKRRSDLALLAGDVGTFDWDIGADRVHGDAIFGRLFGFAHADDGAYPIGDYLARIHPDDRPDVEAKIGRSVADGVAYEAEYRIVRDNGDDRVIVARGRVERHGGAGASGRFIGVLVDITDRKRAEAAQQSAERRYRQLFEVIDEGFCTVKVLFEDDGRGGRRAVDYRFIEVNPAFERQTGLVDAAGRRMRELVPTHEAHWFETYGRVATTGRPARFEHLAAGLGRRYDVYASRFGEPEDDTVAIVFNDVTEREAIAASLRASEAESRFLSDLAQATRQAADPDAVLVAITDGLRSRLAAQRCAYVESVDGSEDVVAICYESLDPARGDRPLAGTYQISDFGPRMLAALRAGETIVCPHVATNPVTRDDSAALTAIGVAAFVNVPLIHEGRLVAILAVHEPRPRAWTDDEVRLCEAVAERGWAEVERTRAARRVIESESRLRELADAMPQIVFTAGAGGEVEYWNRRWYDYTGLPVDGTTGDASWRPLFSDEDGRRIGERWAESLRTGTPYENEFQLRRADGQMRWFLSRLEPVRDAAGRVVRWYGTNTDIDDQKRSAEAAREDAVRLAAALSVADLGTFDWDLLADAVTVDERSREMFAFEPGVRLSAADFFARMNPEESASVQVEVQAAIASGRQMIAEYDVYRPDGAVRRIISNGRFTLDEAGHAVRMAGVFADVTERSRGERALAESEARLRQLADAMPQFVWTALPDGTVDYWNRQWFAHTGLSPDATGDDSWRPAFPAAVGDRIAELWYESVQTGRPYEHQYELRRADGQLRWSLARAEPVRDADGRITRWFGTITDIHDQRLAAEAALTEADRLAGALSAADLGAYEWDRERDVVTADARARAMFGLDADSRLASADFFGRIVDADRRRARAATEAAWTSRETTVTEYDVALPDGSLRRISSHNRVAFGTDGRPQRMYGVFADLTERRGTERAVVESEARLRAMVRATTNVTYRISADWSTLYELNGGAFIADTNQPDRAWMIAYILPEDHAALNAEIDDAIAKRRMYDLEHRVIQADGTVGWAQSRAVPLLDGEGRITEWFGIAADITGRKRDEAERQRLLEAEQVARAEAELAGRMKDEFLATLSHELRTPLSAILGWSQMLARPNVAQEKLASGLATIERNARAQTQIIEDLLDMSRIISGKVALDARPIDAGDVVRAAIETVRATAVAKNIALRFDVPTSERFPATGDFNRLQQVLWNLLSNAIKFTPRGGRVAIDVGQRHSMWQFDITDTGEGMSPDFLPFVFDRFRQADASTTRKHGGLGLGLSIVKQLVDLHGGTIRVRSGGLGQGSTFTVSLPVRLLHFAADTAMTLQPMAAGPAAPSTGVQAVSPAGEREPWDPTLADAIRGRRAVIIDDEPDARGLLKELLSSCGVDVIVTATADEAIAAVERDRPDVLVSDIGMPLVDGYELIRRVRALPADRGGRTPAIALTAYARAEDRVRAVRAGFQTHVPKPVEPAELIAMLASVIR